MSTNPTRAAIAIVGGGPAGLIAATTLASYRHPVELYEALPSVGRKLLVAGVGGLNLTNAEPAALFLSRYGSRAEAMRPWLERFGPEDVCRFARELGVETRVGGSSRVFPVDLKAAPLLRAWVRKLKETGLTIHTRHRLVDLGPGPALTLRRDDDTLAELRPAAVILALGGATWRKLGSDGLWTRLLTKHGVAVKPFRPSNCGFETAWSPHFRYRAEGKPLKNLVLRFGERSLPGELTITRYGLEGTPLYTLSHALRDSIEATGCAVLRLDLKPALSREDVLRRLATRSPGRTTSEVFRRALKLDGVAYPLVREVGTAAETGDPNALASLVKDLPIVLRGVRPLDEAISSEGGVDFEAIDARSMLRALPGFFVAGEMLDYAPPTGGYLLQAAFSSGVAAAEGVHAWLEARQRQ